MLVNIPISGSFYKLYHIITVYFISVVQQHYYMYINITTHSPLFRAAAYCDSIRNPLVGVDAIGFSWLGEMMSTSTLALSLAMGELSVD